MNNPCTWCVNTSSQIDSLDYQLEMAEKKIKELEEIIGALKSQDDGYFDWILHVKIASSWVEDGFNITDDNLVDKLYDWLPYAYNDEVGGKVLHSPSYDSIVRCQGE